jgi:hypothetical protein
MGAGAGLVASTGAAGPAQPAHKRRRYDNGSTTTTTTNQAGAAAVPLASTHVPSLSLGQAGSDEDEEDVVMIDTMAIPSQLSYDVEEKAGHITTGGLRTYKCLPPLLPPSSDSDMDPDLLSLLAEMHSHYRRSHHLQSSHAMCQSISQPCIQHL